MDEIEKEMMKMGNDEEDLPIELQLEGCKAQLDILKHYTKSLEVANEGIMRINDETIDKIRLKEDKNHKINLTTDEVVPWLKKQQKLLRELSDGNKKRVLIWQGECVKLIKRKSPKKKKKKVEYEKCAVCLNDMKPSQKLEIFCNNGHTFHKECYKKMKDMNIKNCPICREPRIARPKEGGKKKRTRRKKNKKRRCTKKKRRRK